MTEYTRGPQTSDMAIGLMRRPQDDENLVLRIVKQRSRPAREKLKWYEPKGEPMQIRFLTPMPDYMFKLPELHPAEHRTDVACILCLMTMEMGYRRLEQQRMDDDGASVRERVRLSDYRKDWNPRFVCWLIAHGYHPDTFETRTDGEVTRVRDPNPEGGTIPCTIAFMFWLQACWREWAVGLGYRADVWNNEPHRNALASGRTPEEFDAWLAKKVGVDL